MEGRYQIKKTHVWAAGLIALLLIVILCSLIFMQHGQLGLQKQDIADLRSEAVRQAADADKLRQISEKHKQAAISEKQRLDSLTAELDILRQQLLNTINSHEENIGNYHGLGPDDRLRLFSGFVNPTK